jgi:hypothetical protein
VLATRTTDLRGVGISTQGARARRHHLLAATSLANEITLVDSSGANGEPFRLESSQQPTPQPFFAGGHGSLKPESLTGPRWRMIRGGSKRRSLDLFVRDVSNYVHHTQSCLIGAACHIQNGGRRHAEK